ncbi:MAG: hypothetical protein VW915_02175, partial [Gammaproteobacteria bacterium]
PPQPHPNQAPTHNVGILSDDPYERFEIQVNSTFAVTSVFNNADIAYTAGDSANYVSKVELDNSTVSTNSAQIRVIGVTKDDENNQKDNATTYSA